MPVFSPRHPSLAGVVLGCVLALGVGASPALAVSVTPAPSDTTTPAPSDTTTPEPTETAIPDGGEIGDPIVVTPDPDIYVDPSAMSVAPGTVADLFVPEVQAGQMVRVAAAIGEGLDPMSLLLMGPQGPATEVVEPGEGTWSVDLSQSLIIFVPLNDTVIDPTPMAYTAIDSQGVPVPSATVRIDVIPVGGEIGDPIVVVPPDGEDGGVTSPQVGGDDGAAAPPPPAPSMTPTATPTPTATASATPTATPTATATPTLDATTVPSPTPTSEVGGVSISSPAPLLPTDDHGEAVTGIVMVGGAAALAGLLSLIVVRRRAARADVRS